MYLQQPLVKKKAKTKIGNKSKKKKKLKTTSKFPDGAEGEHEHQDYCEVPYNSLLNMLHKRMSRVRDRRWISVDVYVRNAMIV